MKQLINVGSVVDDGTGDYLRKGGSKINDNFDELYYNLGDGEVPHSAGAWKTWDSKSGPVSPEFGQSISLDTTSAECAVNLPKGTISDYNKVIKIRDVSGTWNKNPVTIKPAKGDTLKGRAEDKIFNKSLQDLELVYCPPGKWEFAENIFLNKVSSSELSTVIRKQFIAKQGQTDFLNVFEGNSYNSLNTEVFLRGNILYYGESGFDEEYADYGSPLEDSIGPLNGKDIRLKTPCEEGWVVTIVSYLDGVGSWKSSYVKKDLRILDETLTKTQSVPGRTLVMDLSETKVPIEAFGIQKNDGINPFSVEVLLNGRQLLTNKANDDGTEFNFDVDFWYDEDSEVIGLEFPHKLEHNDIITVRWFNNSIGTTLELEDIINETDDLYMNIGSLTKDGGIVYSDTENPSQETVIHNSEVNTYEITDIYSIFDTIYPIGTIYSNAHNPNNPAKYMGVGTWVRYAEGRVIAGWDSDKSNGTFNLNKDHLDEQGNPSSTAGGRIGEMYRRLINSNIPRLNSNEVVLIKDPNGTIVIGGCQYDPDDEGPGFDKYIEDKITINTETEEGLEFELIQPTITAYTWIRVA